MKRAAVLGAAILVVLAVPAGASGPTVQQVAAIVARHKPAIVRDQAAEDDCLRARNSPCDLVQARVARATADAKDSLSLATELERTVGQDAQRAPKKIRSLTNQTIKQARTVATHTNTWLACLDAHTGGPATVCDPSLGYLDDFFAQTTLLNRWRPYLGRRG